MVKFVKIALLTELPEQLFSLAFVVWNIIECYFYSRKLKSFYLICLNCMSKK